MAKAAPDKIVLKENGNSFVKEGTANGVITPGDVLERATDGDFQRGSTALVGGPLLIATRDMAGNEISVDYASGDHVQAVYAQPGDEIYGFVAASAAAIVIGDLLELDGAAGFRKLTTGVAVGSALEAVDNSGGGSKARIKIEVL